MTVARLTVHHPKEPAQQPAGGTGATLASETAALSPVAESNRHTSALGYVSRSRTTGGESLTAASSTSFSASNLRWSR